ncbi:hypothetical protein PQR25_37080 [Paraburkholderia nemoris]|uniref:hypothetical protein n=1 Tax=Paraburkholderia nemoris TaxID=2793076 RepID=UPI0038BCCFEE
MKTFICDGKQPMEPCEIQFTVNSLCHWAGMGDYVLFPPDRSYEMTLRYEGEPPHGDSYHVVDIAGRRFPGYAWGCMFAMSECSNFIAFSWMEKKFERLTTVIDVRHSRYLVLPRYIYHPHIEWPSVLDATNDRERYAFDGTEAWGIF